MRPCRWMLLCALLYCVAVPAQDRPAAASSAVPELAATVVSGELPGPGLWKVSRGDHVLWILGVLRPLPRHMDWRPDEVEQVLADAQAVLQPPGITLHADVGWFGKLALLPRLVGARNNPDGRKLAQVLPPADYARWQRLAPRYLGHGHRVEKYRPMFAALKLHEAAVKAAGLSDDDSVGVRVRKLAKKHGVQSVSTAYAVTVAEPKKAIKAFRASSMDDIACFEDILDLVEYRLPEMQMHANAWAVGDLEALQRLPRDAAGRACADALSGADFARQQGLDDLETRVTQSWLDAADKALAENHSTLALVPVGRLLAADGLLARLAARGGTVQAPDAIDDDGPLPAPAASAL